MDRTIRKNAIWLFIGQSVGRTLRTLIIIYSARILGAASWGAFSYALALATFLTVFSDIGVNALLTREATKNPELRSRYISASLFVKGALLLGFGAIIILFGAKLTNIAEVATLLPYVVFIFVFDALRDMGAAISRALERMEIEGRNNVLTNALIAALGFAFLIFNPTSGSLMFGYTLGVLLGLLSIAIDLRHHIKGIFTHFDKGLAIWILKTAWPFGILSIMSVVMINTDILMIGWMLDARDVGLYAAGQKIVQLLYMLPTLLATAFFPRLAKLVTDTNQFRKTFESALTIIFMAALPLSIGSVLLAGPIIDLVYGAEYLEGATSFLILSSTMLIVFPAILIGNAVFAHNEQRAFLIYATAGMVGNIIFNILFIPILGIVGAAVSTLANQLIIVGWGWWKMKRINYFRILPHMPKILLSSAIMTAGIILMQTFGVHVMVNVVFSAAIYFGMLYALKERAIHNFIHLKEEL
ncbi:MAG: flippase [Candidatus Colwellbacteria bacterium]|nr:flippase [Candidatus Colwellbacteria bacterium]